MTGLGAIDQDVEFDFAAASDLAADLRAAATELSAQVTERGNARSAARELWQGRYGDEFDDRVTTCTGDAERFVTSMNDAADDLDELARLAEEEQARREAAREWVASQQDDGGGGFGIGPVSLPNPVDMASDALDAAGDLVFGEDDVPPDLAPVEPPSIPIGDPGAVTREGAAAAPQSYGSGGVSSASPDDLDAWASASRLMDETLSLRRGWLDEAHAAFTASLGWGSFDASSMLSGFGTWLSLNETDAQWVAQIAMAFREAGAGRVPDAVIEASLVAAGLNTVGRVSVTFDDPVIWGEPATSGYADDPVNTASGNFVESEVDLDVGGLCRLLRFGRTYNSRSDRVGPFGRGWGSWVSVRLTAGPDGARWVGPDGQEAVFPRVAQGDDGVAYQRVVGVPGMVVVDGDGLVLEGLGDGSRVAFDRDGRPVAASNGPGTRVEFGHDDEGRLVGMRHEGGKSLSLLWNDDGDRVVGLRCSDGRSVRYRYDDESRLIEVDGGPRGLRRYELDSGARVAAVVDADGVVEAHNSYDDEGRVVSQESPFGRRTRYRYLAGRVTIVDDDAAGPVNSYVHDDHGRLVGLVDGHGNELRKRYDRWGNPVEVVERDGTVTRMEWDDHARLTRRVAPDGSWFAFTYDELGRTVKVAASTGATTRLRYEGEERNPVEIVDPEGGVTRLEAEGGLIRRIVDPDGVEVRYGFDANGALTSVTDAVGNTATVERDPAGRVTATVSPSGLRTELVYDGAGRLVERRDPGGRPPHSRYSGGPPPQAADAGGGLAQGRDPGGAVTRFEWSPAGRLIATVDPTGARRELRYGANGAAEQVVDELGQVTTRRFDALGNLVGVVLPDGAKWELDYDRLCRLTGVSDPAGATWLREYDAAGHLAGTIDPVGAHRTTALDGSGRIVGVDDGLTSVAFDHDELGRAVAHRRPEGTEANATYDLCGRITAVTDPGGGVTRYEYTPAGRLAAVVSPLGHVTRYDHDSTGRRTAVIDALGNRWAYRYDADGRVTQVVAPTGEITRFRYDESGRLAARISSTGGTTRYDYDPTGRVVAVTDPTGGVTRYVWDARGQLVEAVDANGGVSRYERDERGFLRSLVDPLGGRVEHRYDPLGRLVERRDQLGRSTHWEYDPAGRLIKRVLATGEQVRWWYDSSGRVAAVGIGDDQLIRIERDLLGRPVVVEEPGFRHELDWDRHGRLVARRRNGLGLTWRYDPDGRRVAIGYPDGTETAFDHDAAGRPITATHPLLGTVDFDHDAAGRLTRCSYSGGSERWHYSDGLLARHETRRDGPLVGHEIDGQGRGHVTDLERDPADRVVAATTDGTHTTYRYDPADQLTAVHGPDGAWTFNYDPAGRLTSETNPTAQITYTHDPAHELIERATRPPEPGARAQADDKATRPGDDAAVQLREGRAGDAVARPGDEAVDQMQEGPAAEAGTRSLGNADQPLTEGQAGGAAARSGDDAADQLRERQAGEAVTRCGCDEAGRRAAVTSPDGTTLSYAWDWLGRLAGIGDTRLRVDALGDLADIDGMPLLWDPVGAVPQLRWVDGMAVVGDQQPWATIDRDRTISWLARDWQGSVTKPVALAGSDATSDGGGASTGGPAGTSADAAGQPGAAGVLDRGFDPWGAPIGDGGVAVGLDPWGAPLGPGGDGSLVLGYRGELAIDGHLWLRNRVYDPATRGFLSTDPLPGVAGDPFGANSYHYAGNNPIGAFDPLGLRPVTEAQFSQYREAMAGNGLFDHIDNAWDATTEWAGDAAGAVGGFVADNWEYIALAGVVVAATVIGGPVGMAMVTGMLISGGLSAGVQYATTGQVAWDQVAMNAAIGGAAGGVGAWAGGTSLAASSTMARYGTQMAADAGTNVVGGMIGRAAAGQEIFDPRAMATDTLTGSGTGAVGARLGTRALPERTVTMGDPGDGLMGVTDQFGNITIREGLPPEQLEATLRHEQVHAALSPREGTVLANTRARVQMELYRRSQLARFGEEALAEGYATGSISQGLKFPLQGGYDITPGGLALEGVSVVGGGVGTVGAVETMTGE